MLNRGLTRSDIARKLSHLTNCLAYPQWVWLPVAHQLADDPDLLQTILEKLIAEDMIEIGDMQRYRIDYATHNPRQEILSASSVSITLRSCRWDPLHLNLTLDANEFLSPLLTR
jgi:hypothetical protein